MQSVRSSALQARFGHGRLALGAQRTRRPLQCRAEALVPVKLVITREVNFGESHKIVGSLPELGAWDPEDAPDMEWGDGHVWSLALDVPVGTEVEFKCIKAGPGEAEWEGGHNRKFKPLGPDHGLVIHMKWGATDELNCDSYELDGSEPRAENSQEQRDKREQDREERRRRKDQERQQRDEQRGSRSGGSSFDEGAFSDGELGSGGWVGRDIQFMRSNEHSKDRQGKWDTHGLQGVELQLVQGDERSGSWLQKLQLAKNVLVDQSHRARPDLDTLAAVHVYLTWVNNGALPCVEGGGHYRPNHHAELAKEMFRSLEWAMEDLKWPNALGAFLARKIHSNIPCFDKSFTASVPLTRIRDIAHRGDIPHELKQEIKHTLQNKLHRNAGPEDLVATEAMLKRITAEPGKYSEAFVNEFKIFYAELRDFFNAATLTTLLDEVRSSFNGDASELQFFDRFSMLKRELDGKDQPSDNDLMDVMHSLTTVRALLANGLSSGLRNDAPDDSMIMRQRWRLAEVRAEEFFFVLLSRFINLQDSRGGYGSLAKSGDGSWALPIGATVLALRHLGLTGWNPGELVAIENELSGWQKKGQFLTRDGSLRLKATLERLQRLTSDWTEQMLATYPRPAHQLGQALGVPHHMHEIFTESEIRSSLMFQLSKQATLLLKAARQVAGCGEWDAVVAGTACGKLMAVDAIDPVALQGLQEDVVLLVKNASGDEEVGTAGSRVKGVVLCQELPHLSHLGVRARQEKVPFATVDDPEFLSSKVRPLLGRQVMLRVSADSVSLTEDGNSSNGNGNGNGNGVSSRPSNNGKAAIAAAKIVRCKSFEVLPMQDCELATAGAKAAACAQLEQIAVSAAGGGAGFRTPAGCSIPFGTLELALQQLPAVEQRRYDTLLTEIEAGEVSQLEGLCIELQDLILDKLRPAPAVLRAVTRLLGEEVQVICRSSANVEDLAGMSGAGLYDSIPNISSSDHEELAYAVACVWASLYTRRAVMSRRAAGVPERQACMAVLVQEMVAPEVSFVIHTTNPIDNNSECAYVELAAGLGETLASGQRGTPFRLQVRKDSGATTTLTYANFSEAYVAKPSERGSWREAPEAQQPRRLVDYSQLELTQDDGKRAELGAKLGKIAVLLEQRLGGPQDVEGCVADGVVYIVQSRPQP